MKGASRTNIHAVLVSISAISCCYVLPTDATTGACASSSNEETFASSSTTTMAQTEDLKSVEDAAAHSAVTIALAKKESAEHMHGMDELFKEMRKRPLLVKAFALDDQMCPDAASPNVKTVHFVRHGQGFHNLMADQYTALGRTWTQFTQDPNNPYTLPEITDAPLTEKGRQQAYLLQSRVNQMPNPPQLIALSPNCRALQTGLIVFESLVGKAAFMAHEMVREETGVHVCDRRRPVSRQKSEFPQIDFSLLESDYDPLFTESQRETKQQVGDRIYKFMEWLSNREEKCLAVSSHSGWLLTVFNGILECDDSLKAWFQTGEMRSVVLEFTRQE